LVVIAGAELLAVPDTRNAAIVGEPHWDPWHDQERFDLYSMLIDPTRLYRPGVELFEVGGDPAFALLASAEGAGLKLTSFPFTAEGPCRAPRKRKSRRRRRQRRSRPPPVRVGGAEDRYAQLLSRFEDELGGPLADRFVPTVKGRP
jgi:hypothetical protein